MATLDIEYTLDQEFNDAGKLVHFAVHTCRASCINSALDRSDTSPA
jgi:hypothetical protein